MKLNFLSLCLLLGIALATMPGEDVNCNTTLVTLVKPSGTADVASSSTLPDPNTKSFSPTGSISRLESVSWFTPISKTSALNLVTWFHPISSFTSSDTNAITNLDQFPWFTIISTTPTPPPPSSISSPESPSWFSHFTSLLAPTPTYPNLESFPWVTPTSADPPTNAVTDAVTNLGSPPTQTSNAGSDSSHTARLDPYSTKTGPATYIVMSGRESAEPFVASQKPVVPSQALDSVQESNNDQEPYPKFLPSMVS